MNGLGSGPGDKRLAIHRVRVHRSFRERRRINRKCLLRNRTAADVRKGEHEEISR